MREEESERERVGGGERELALNVKVELRATYASMPDQGVVL